MTVREDRSAGTLRGVLATVALLIAVVAGLALVGSFFLEPTPGESGGPRGTAGTGTGTGGDGGGVGTGDAGSGGGERPDVDCRAVTRPLGAFAAATGAATVLFAVLAVVRGRAVGKGFMETAWGPACLAVGSITLVLLAVLGVMLVVCDMDPSGDAGGSGGDAGGGADGGGGGGGGGGGSEGTGTDEVPPPPKLPDWSLLLLVLAGLALLALLLYVALQARRGTGAAVTSGDGGVHAREHKELRRILDHGELCSSETVVASYRAFLAWADGRGLPRASEDTPMEHAQRVAGRFHFPPDEMRSFVAAYQVARLSGREPSPDEREHALRFSHGLPEREGPS